MIPNGSIRIHVRKQERRDEVSKRWDWMCRVKKDEGRPPTPLPLLPVLVLEEDPSPDVLLLFPDDDDDGPPERPGDIDPPSIV